MSTLNVDKVDPSRGTALEIGSSGDTITIPSGATIVNSGTATGFGVGKIGQVSTMAQTYTQTGFTSSTLADWSGMTCALTPTATSSKIIVMGAAHIFSPITDNVNIVLLRDDGDGYDIIMALGDYIGYSPVDIGDLIPICFVDSPSVTVAVSYKLQYRSDGGGQCYVNLNDGSNSPTNQEGSNSYLYCMEVLT